MLVPLARAGHLGPSWDKVRYRLAGAEGFEPAHAGTKNRCLTAWLRPNSRCDGRSIVQRRPLQGGRAQRRSEEQKSELQSLMRKSYTVLCLNKIMNETNT